MSQSNQVRLRNQTRKQFKRQLPLHLFVWAGILFLVLFSIIPMSGVIIAFKDYNIKAGFKGMFTAPWTANSGFKHFITFVTNRKFSVLVRNTVIISSLKLLFAFPFAILFAIMVTEVRSNAYKRIVQTASYLPHFVSWIVVAGIVYAMFSTNIGVINELLLKLGWIKEPIPLLLEAKYYYLLATASEIWKETGWSAIIYLAAIAGIDPALYESAQVDGAGRLRRIWHITLPGILPTIVIMLILSIGGMMSVGWEKAFLLQVPATFETSDIVSTYVYRKGFQDMDYSFSTAVDLFNSGINVILLAVSNFISRKVTDSSLW